MQFRTGLTAILAAVLFSVPVSVWAQGDCGGGG